MADEKNYILVVTVLCTDTYKTQLEETLNPHSSGRVFMPCSQLL